MPDDTTLPIGGEDGHTPDMRATCQGLTACAVTITDDVMRSMLTDATILLYQVFTLTSGVLDTIRVGDVRKLVAAEMPAAAGHIQLDGTFTDKPAEPEQPAPAEEEGRDPSTGSGQDHRKKPRGRTHPLIALIKLAMQAVRLMKQIAGGTHPGALNKLSQSDRLMRDMAKSDGEFYRYMASQDS